MTISNNDLTAICNYSESTKPSQPNCLLSFMDFEEEPNDVYQRELKRKNRELAIDAILDNKIEEFKSREIDPLDNEGYMSTIAPKVKTINVQGKSYLDLTDIYIDIMNTLELLTMNPMNIPQKLNINYQKDPKLTDYDNEMAKSIRIMSRISMTSNLIAASSRVGLANTIISGLDVYKYLMISNAMMVNQEGIINGNIMGMNVITSPYIKSNKIIIMRNSKSIEAGLNVINHSNDMIYFLKETSNWEKRINWFEVI
jgi:hypothetical protein